MAISALLRDTSDRFGMISKAFHWVVGFSVLGLIGVGLWMEDLPLSPDKFEIYGWHKSAGITVLALMAARFVWRMVNPRPAFLGEPGWQKTASVATHHVMYLCLFAMPLIGWVNSAASNFPVNVWGMLTLPAIVDPNPDLAAATKAAHTYVGWVLMVLIILHVGAALKHHFADRDDTLRRMLPFGRLRSESPAP